MPAIASSSKSWFEAFASSTAAACATMASGAVAKSGTETMRVTYSSRASPPMWSR